MAQANPSALSGLKGIDGTLSQGTRPARTLRRRNAIVACSFDAKEKLFLDLGCAEGLHSLYIADRGGAVLGVDHRPSVIARAKATQAHVGIERVKFFSADAREHAFWSELPPVDIAIAWGLLHRVSDAFRLLINLASVAQVISLEWRTPVVPFLQTARFAYHSGAGVNLDPMNLQATAEFASTVENKVEGLSGFWEPTPGAVKTILGRVNFTHSKVLGYGEHFVSTARIYARAGSCLALKRYPTARVHMLFARREQDLETTIFPLSSAEIPRWDESLHQHLRL